MGERTSAAIERIERALARIESAASRAQPAAAPADGEEVAALREAHRTLRARVESAVGQIDRLLASEASG